MPALKRPDFAPEIDPRVSVSRQKVGNIAQPEDKVRTSSISREQPFLLDGDFLLTTNNSDKDTYVFRWNRKSYVISPGESKHVVFEALVDALGDPRSMDNEVVRYNDGNGARGIILQRHSELSRLFGRYAIENEAIDDWTDKLGKRQPGLLNSTPDVSCETLNGVRVTFPASRPDMLPMPVPQVDERKIDVDQKQITDRLAADNDEMREQLRLTNERMDKLLAEREGVATE